ncbi:hypothetical protein UK12_35235, partial [Saccharothrix sp. ST-888]
TVLPAPHTSLTVSQLQRCPNGAPAHYRALPFRCRQLSGQPRVNDAEPLEVAGSELPGNRAHPVDHGDHYLLHGARPFNSNATLADLDVVAARTTREVVVHG